MPYVFSGFGVLPQPFYRQDGSTLVFIRALQKLLHTAQTGLWAPEDHDALRTLIKMQSVEIGVWGMDPAKVARNATLLAKPSSASEFQVVKPLLETLGLPSASLNAYFAMSTPDQLALFTALDTVEDAIKTAEQRVVQQPRVDPVLATMAVPERRGSFGTVLKANVGLVAVGVAGLTLLVAAIWVLVR